MNSYVCVPLFSVKRLFYFKINDNDFMMIKK